MKRAGKVILIILLAVVILFGAIPFAYLNLAGFEYGSGSYDAVMPSGERFSFEPAVDKMEIRLDASDLYWLSDLKSEGTGAVDSLNTVLESYKLKVVKTGLAITDSGLFVTAKLMWKKLIPIPVAVSADLALNGRELTAEVKAVSLGRFISLSADRLSDIPGFDDEAVFSLDLKGEHPFFASVCDMRIENGNIIFTCAMPYDWIVEDIPSILSDFTIQLDFVRADEISPLLPALLAYCDGDTTALDERIEALGSDSASFEPLKAEIIAISGSYSYNRFFNQSNWNARFFPEMTLGSISQMNVDILAGGQAKYDERIGLIAAAEMDASLAVADGTLKIKNGSFFYSDGTEYSIPDTDKLGQWMDADSLRLVNAVNPGDYMQNIVGKSNKLPVLIGRTSTGRPVVFYQYTQNQFVVQSLTEKEYTEAFNSRSVPTIDLGKATTK